MIYRMFIAGLLAAVLCGTAAFANLIQFSSASGGGGIAFVNAADLGNGTSAGFTSSAYSVTTGTQLQICVVGDVGGNTDDLTAVSYGGSSATRSDARGGGNRWLYIYHLESPPTGSHTVVLTGGNHFWTVGVAEYSGANTTGQPDAVTDNGVLATSISTTTTTVADNSWVISCEGGFSANQPPTAGAGATLRAVEGSFGAWGIFDSNAVVHPAGNYAMTVNAQGGANIVLTMISNSIKP